MEPIHVRRNRYQIQPRAVPEITQWRATERQPRPRWAHDNTGRPRQKPQFINLAKASQVYVNPSVIKCTSSLFENELELTPIDIKQKTKASASRFRFKWARSVRVRAIFIRVQKVTLKQY